MKIVKFKKNSQVILIMIILINIQCSTNQLLAFSSTQVNIKSNENSLIRRFRRRFFKFRRRPTISNPFSILRRVNTCIITPEQSREIIELEKIIKSLITFSEYQEFLNNDFDNTCPKKKLDYRREVFRQINQN